MKKYLYIGAGGFVGAILRYAVRSIEMDWPGQFPLTTFAINILGCILLGLILSLSGQRVRINAQAQLGIAVGFLGALTTFSTVCRELIDMVHLGQTLTALSYGILSVLFGLAAVYGGARLAARISAGSVRSPGDFAATISSGEGEES